MNTEEISELLDLKDWNETQLAAAMHMSAAGVYKWMRTDGCPRGPAEVLMRIWLAEARDAKGIQRKPVAAK